MFPSHSRHPFARRASHVAMHIVRLCLLLALFSLAVMWLWNRVVPSLFHLPLLTYGKALGLTLLCRILFGGRMSPRRHFRFQGGEARPPRFPWPYAACDHAHGDEGDSAR
jgi:hypothetical protein